MTKTVLIVDDSKSMRVLTAHTLKKAGFEVVEAENGQQAMQLLSQGPRPNLILTDLNMPFMNGFELMGAVRKDPQFGKVPILFLTTESGEEEKNRGRQAGANGWIVKPFHPEKLVNAINSVCS